MLSRRLLEALGGLYQASPSFLGLIKAL